LDPLGSPGPVTPLALEEEGDYLAAGAGSISIGGSPVMSGDEGTRAENKRSEKMSRGSGDSKDGPVFVTSRGEINWMEERASARMKDTRPRIRIVVEGGEREEGEQEAWEEEVKDAGLGNQKSIRMRLGVSFPFQKRWD
jgi:hypothetical protein